jgi:drug/metabolite transporter (DMT)-like permease
LPVAAYCHLPEVCRPACDGNVPIRTYIVLAIAVLSQAAGNVFLSKGMKDVASAVQSADISFFPLILQAAGSPLIWSGTGLLIIFFVLFLTVLSLADLSFVLPVISIEVIANVAFASYFLNEPVSTVRWLGTALISLGVILVFRSAGNKQEADEG